MKALKVRNAKIVKMHPFSVLSVGWYIIVFVQIIAEFRGRDACGGSEMFCDPNIIVVLVSYMVLINFTE
ncbi:hypothetical protein [Desulforhopalus sp. IMCC35007]|uniref:hypothetical protein n=1 Tax=Desulforhopalus sp. IMCC35007 TaxID=2569543 RepID=UPI00145F5812|nr:hypothetical protein [Desulforhopalus sp. IMCC35007]